jgi:hypothetical protein
MSYKMSEPSSAGEFPDMTNRDQLPGIIAGTQMPPVSGLDLASTLPSKAQPLPVILITARPNASYDDEAAPAGSVSSSGNPSIRTPCQPKSRKISGETLEGVIVRRDIHGSIIMISRFGALS